MFTVINQQDLDDLCSELKLLLESELTAGNEVIETSRGWPLTGSIFVQLKYPFKVKPAELPAFVEYRQLNDPHWWKAEYHFMPKNHILACGF